MKKENRISGIPAKNRLQTEALLQIKRTCENKWIVAREKMRRAKGRVRVWGEKKTEQRSRRRDLVDSKYLKFEVFFFNLSCCHLSAISQSHIAQNGWRERRCRMEMDGCTSGNAHNAFQFSNKNLICFRSCSVALCHAGERDVVMDVPPIFISFGVSMSAHAYFRFCRFFSATVFHPVFSYSLMCHALTAILPVNLLQFFFLHFHHINYRHAHPNGDLKRTEIHKWKH